MKKAPRQGALQQSMAQAGPRLWAQDGGALWMGKDKKGKPAPRPNGGRPALLRFAFARALP